MAAAIVIEEIEESDGISVRVHWPDGEPNEAKESHKAMMIILATIESMADQGEVQ